MLRRHNSVNTLMMVNTKEMKNRADKYSMEDDISCFMCGDEVFYCLDKTNKLINKQTNRLGTNNYSMVDDLYCLKFKEEGLAYNIAIHIIQKKLQTSF